MRHIAQRPPRLPHAAIVRAPGLLPMLYTPAELEEALGLPARYIRDWLDAHAVPHQRDATGHIWINGRDFAAWVERTRLARRQSSLKLADDEAFCMRCHKAVPFRDPVPILKGKRVLWRGVCPECGDFVHRG